VNFLADECCDAPLVEALRIDGHDILYVIESLRGEPDEKILDRDFNENRILITEDKDFGELVYRLKLPARGIILLRFDTANRVHKILRLRSLLEQESRRLQGAFITLSVNKTRIRPMP